MSNANVVVMVAVVADAVTACAMVAVVVVVVEEGGEEERGPKPRRGPPRSWPRALAVRRRLLAWPGGRLLFAGRTAAPVFRGAGVGVRV